MGISEAIEFIQNGHYPLTERVAWADLGCGSGVFTFALANLLPSGSLVYAVDKEPIYFNGNPHPKGTVIYEVHMDFEVHRLPLHNLDGIMMANSLHYVADKPALLERLSMYKKPESPFLIVEYDADKPVAQWVPYPLSFKSLQKLFNEAGYSTVEKLGERPSLYGRANMYAAWVSF